MSYYSYIQSTGELLELPEEYGIGAAYAVIETHPHDIVFEWDGVEPPAEVWLALERVSYYEGSDVLGVYSSKDKAKQVCQNRETNWWKHGVNPLPWGEDYPDQAEGYLRHYSVRKVKVDKEFLL